MKIIICYWFVTLVCSCGDNRHTLGYYGWSSIDPTFDSLTLAAERYLFLPNYFDSTASNVGKMKAYAATLEGDKARMAEARAMYWDAYSRTMAGEQDGVFNELDSAMSLAESVKDEYTAHRINTMDVWFRRIEDEQILDLLLKDLDYYRELGDVAMQAFSTLFISNSLITTDVPELSLRYMQISDSLFALSGLEEQRKNMRWNEALLLCKTNQLDAGKYIFEELLNDSTLNCDPVSREQLLRNHYYFFKDSASLFEGYKIVKPLCPIDSPAVGFAALRGLYEGLLLEHYNNAGDLDSAMVYLALANKHINEPFDIKYQRDVSKIMADFTTSNDMPEIALTALNRMTTLQKILDEGKESDRKIYLERVNSLKQYEAKAEAERRDLRVKYSLLIAILVLTVIIMLLVVRNWRHRQKVKFLEAKMEIDQKERQILAMSLLQEESNKMLEYVKDETSRLSGEYKVSGRDISNIASNVKLHLADKNDFELFEKTFAKIHPDFLKRLREVAPNLSENNVRLCSYLMMGMSNAEIAGVMNIRSASLRQSRLRLRQKFGLTKDDSLEDFLRRLADK